MAAEAQAESPGPVPPPPLPARGSSSASPEKRPALTAPENDGGGGSGEEERLLPEPKRRRASVAALDGVPPAAAAGGAEREGASGDADGASFSFQLHRARGGFVAPEATPKFGSFHPPGEDAEPAALDLKPAERDGDGDGEGSLEPGDGVPAASARGAEDKDEGGEVNGQVQT